MMASIVIKTGAPKMRSAYAPLLLTNMTYVNVQIKPTVIFNIYCRKRKTIKFVEQTCLMTDYHGMMSFNYGMYLQ